MRLFTSDLLRLTLKVATIFLLFGLPASNTSAAEDLKNVAFPGKLMVRLSAYNITSADTDFAVFGSSGFGTAVSFDRDLGGDDSVSTGRIDGYYRFNERHRIDFSNFSTDREGSKTLETEIDIGDVTYFVGDVVESRFKFDLLRVGYAYSFHHSPTVELSLSAGLNINSYDYETSLASGGASTSSDVSAPLPTFGFRLAYKITPNWSVHYLSETFFINIEDELKGTLLNYELNVEYRFDGGFALGLGIARTSTDLDADSSDWSGSVTDSNRGFLLFGSYYF